MRNKKLIWIGESQINKDKICLFITGFVNSSNPKTGPMIQTYILKWGRHPVEDRREGAEAICGSCPLQKGICYVGGYTLNQVYDPTLEISSVSRTELIGRSVRLGSYGDPAAIPFDVWKKNIINKADYAWGYTHQWRTCDPRFADYCLASVETLEQAQEAWDRGWKTYRILLPSEEPISSEEMWCPHYINGFQCFQCKHCDPKVNNFKKGVVVTVHGKKGTVKKYEKLRRNMR